MKNCKRVLLSFVCALLLLCCLTGLTGCNKSGAIKLGVIREDDTSAEATAWEEYLNGVGADLNITLEFVTTTSATDEVNAVTTFASKGCKGILLFSDDDVVATCTAANDNRMYVVIPTGNPTAEQVSELNKLEYYLGSVAPDENTDYKAGYDMAKYFVEELKQTKFTVFGGATCYGVQMHVQRLVGMLAYLCEDSSTNYDGATDRGALTGKTIGQGVDPAKFVSTKYTITGYMDGFAFDDAFSTKLTQSLAAGGTAILCVGASDAVVGIGFGIASGNPAIDAGSLKVGGVDAITEGYMDIFNIGYTYDCGKYASCMAPGLAMILRAINGNKLVDESGNAPDIAASYWVATSKADLEAMIKNDNKTDGYLYNANVIKHYMEASYSEFVQLCNADYNKALTIRDQYSK